MQKTCWDRHRSRGRLTTPVDPPKTNQEDDRGKNSYPCHCKLPLYLFADKHTLSVAKCAPAHSTLMLWHLHVTSVQHLNILTMPAGAVLSSQRARSVGLFGRNDPPFSQHIGRTLVIARRCDWSPRRGMLCERRG